MPSETMNLHGVSSSSYLSDERQVGFWKTDNQVDNCGVKEGRLCCIPCSLPVALSPMEKSMSMESQATKCSKIHNNNIVLGQEANLNLQRQAIGAERAACCLGLLNPMDHDPIERCNLDVQSALIPKEGDKCHMMSSHYENGLFSSSLSELFSKKLNLTSKNELYGHSVDTVASHYEEEEPVQSLKEIEAQTIGDLLPEDDDLFSGVADGIEQICQSSAGDDIEDLDFFSSIGGMELGDDSSSGKRNSDFGGGMSNYQLVASNISIVGEHSSRTLFVRNINSNVKDCELQTLFEQYGDIHTLYTACKHRGFVMISYYDIRAAQNAMKALQSKPFKCRKHDIHYSIPKDNPSEKDVNQGILVVFNLDSSISNDELHRIFSVYGEIKEICETPHRSNQKFIEFYDTRAAEAALHALNRSDFVGKRIKFEQSLPGGLRQSSSQQLARDMVQEEPDIHAQKSTLSSNGATGFSGPFLHGSFTSNCYRGETGLGNHAGKQTPANLFGIDMFNQGISSSMPPGLPSVFQVQSAGNQSGLSGSVNCQTKYDFHGKSTLQRHSFPEYHDGLTNGAPCNSPGNMPGVLSSLPLERAEKPHFGRIATNGHSLEMGNGFGSSGNGSCRIPGHYMWPDSNQQAQTLMWPNSFSSMQSPSRVQGLARTSSHLMNSVIFLNNHHAGSAPAVNPLWDRRNSYPVGSPETSGFHQSSLGSMRLSGSPLHHMKCVSHSIFPCIVGNCMDQSIPSRNSGFNSHQQRFMVYPSRGQMNSVTNSFEHSNERPRNRRNENTSQADNKKQYELDIDRILRGEDNRTTLMIKNIPNKYTSKMLMTAIDERHRGTYDFIYLPIDFKNKCNVGYAFINMIDPSHIIPFFEAFNGKKWEKFNSEKVASLAYARIQGKAALIAHFQNSSLMNEDKRCRPILFHTDGPNAGDQVPFPMGVNVRSRPGKSRTGSSEDSHHESPTSSVNKEGSSNLDSSFGSGKE